MSSWLVEKLPRYSEWSSCKKCGAPSFAIATRHTRIAFGVGEVIRRTCGRCGFVWDERPLDTPAALPPPSPACQVSRG